MRQIFGGVFFAESDGPFRFEAGGSRTYEEITAR
jgi:hypothetical protein